MATEKQHVNPDLDSERKTATFDPSELTTIIDLGEKNTQARRSLEKFFYEDPRMPDTLALLNLSSDELQNNVLETAKYFDRKIQNADISLSREWANNPLITPTAPHIRNIAYPSENPLSIHSSLFIPTISKHATDEQQARWIPLIKEQKMFGTYAQTELGHGSVIRELETTAIYDHNSKEFVLNSPTVTAIKCWPGGLGRACNYVVLMAQLRIKDKSYGIHMFLVQIRNSKDHRPMPGIIVGDIGPKMGMLATDNGYLKFNNVRIPRENMLMRHVQVLEDGTYIKPKVERVNYGMMVYVRVGVVFMCALQLGQACTIAVRYNVVRRQGRLKKDGPEIKILDYQTQQFKLIPQVALAYGFYFTFRKLGTYYMQMISEDNADYLSEIHALSSGMKALSSHFCSLGAEICRQACGGLGYLQASRLPMLCNNILAACTYEGDNTILQLQVARYLIKSLKMVENGEDVGDSVKYLRMRAQSEGAESCLTEFVNVFEVTGARMIKNVAEKLERCEKRDDGWQENTVELAKCANFHSQVYVIRSIHEALCDIPMSESLRSVMEKLFELLSIYLLQENMGNILLFGGISHSRVNELRERIPNLLKILRPNVVALVDAFDFCDATLHSVIGCYDGRVYERLYDYWSRLPANLRQKNHLKSSL